MGDKRTCFAVRSYVARDLAQCARIRELANVGADLADRPTLPRAALRQVPHGGDQKPSAAARSHRLLSQEPNPINFLDFELIGHRSMLLLFFSLLRNT